MLARSETDLTPIFCAPDGTRLTMRDDALPSKVQTRIDTYHKETAPLLEKLKTDFNYKVFQVDGMPNIPIIKETINTIIDENLQ